jgi:hypothetical protein
MVAPVKTKGWIKIMKKRILGIILTLAMVGLTACGNTQSASDNSTVGTTSGSQTTTQATTAVTNSTTAAQGTTSASSVTVQETTATTSTSNVLVTYFSCTNTTKGVAETIAEVTGGDLWEITPVQAYTSDDLNWGNKTSRSTTEQNDSSSRPQIQGSISNLNNYSYIFIGFPIWWYEEPRIIDTFMESYDFTGKTVITFCTSGGSSIGKADSNMKALSKGYGAWVTGDKLDGGASADTIKTWVNGLGTGITTK